MEQDGHIVEDFNDPNLESDSRSLEILDCYEKNGGQADEEVSISITTPALGMIFDNDNDAYIYYNTYARAIGFSVRVMRSRKNKRGEIRGKHLCCSCEGWYQQKSTPQKKKRDERRCGCEAMFEVHRTKEGKFKLVKFEASHNHDLVPPSSTNLLRSQRKIEESQADLISQMHSAGLKPSQIFSYMSTEAGGSQKLNFTQADCNNFIMRRRAKFLERGDAKCLLDYFKKKKIEDESFFYEIRTNLENEITGCFFCDGRARQDYDVFGDVVCFDTTFKTNNYNMVCAPIVGLNNHGQTVLFGCALLDGETTEACAWLFKVFLRAMKGKKPKTIFTDQAASISAAIREVLPECHHRLCLWHIWINAGKNINQVFGEFKTFAADFRKCIYYMETPEDFESSWISLLDKYNLVENTWLDDMYKVREKWAQAYGRSHFCAGMTTSQRSESINKFLKNYFEKNLILSEFVVQYERAVADRREKERQAENATRQTKRNLVSRWKVELEASEKYTSKIFYVFQHEYNKVLDVKLELTNDDGTTHIYKAGSSLRRTLTYTPSTQSVSCSCKKFEFEGILCAHALKLFRELDVSSLPSQYYLKRWTKDATVGVNFDSWGNSTIHKLDSSSTVDYSELSHIAQRIVAKSATEKSLCTFVKSELLKLEGKLKSRTRSQQEKVVEDGTSGDIVCGSQINGESVTLQMQSTVALKSGDRCKATAPIGDINQNDHLNENEASLELKEPKVKKPRGPRKGKVPSTTKKDPSKRKDSKGTGSKKKPKKGDSKELNDQVHEVYEPTSVAGHIEVSSGLPELASVQNVPTRSLAQESIALNNSFGLPIVPAFQSFTSQLLGVGAVPTVQGTHFPYEFPNYSNVPGIHNLPSNYQVIRPVVYDYSSMYSQTCFQPRPQGPARQN